MPARCASWASRSRVCRRIGSRGSVRGMVFQHSRPLHRQTVLENIMLALVARQADAAFSRPRNRSARARDRRARRAWRRDRSPAGDIALRRSAQDGARQGDRARSAGRAGRRALRRARHRARTKHFSELISELRDDGRAVLLVDHNVKSVAALVDRVFAMYVGERIAEGTAEEVMRDETGAPRLSRRQHRDGGASGIRLPRQDAVSPGRERQRPLRQGAGAGERVDPRPPGRVRLGRRPQRRRQDDLVQRDFRPAALFRRDPPRGQRACAA